MRQQSTFPRTVSAFSVQALPFFPPNQLCSYLPTLTADVIDVETTLHRDLSRSKMKPFDRTCQEIASVAARLLK
jgi:hypothetical protein